jgi:cytochrome c oxidase subunit 2
MKLLTRACRPGLLAACVSGCAGPQSMLNPAGPSAQAIAAVWWWMLGGATLVLLAVVSIWLLAMWRNRQVPTLAGDNEAARSGQRWIVGGGIVLPVVVITALLVFGTSAGQHQLPLPPGWPGAAGPAALRIEVTGQQWWWSLHYPDSGVRLRNELRLPVGRPVDIQVGSRDVIHSFWVPRLSGKLDAIPGRTSVVRLQADQPGTFRGQCAEFCGLNHAHMVMTVIAMPAVEFDTWLAARSTVNVLGAEQ